MNLINGAWEIEERRAGAAMQREQVARLQVGAAIALLRLLMLVAHPFLR